MKNHFLHLIILILSTQPIFSQPVRIPGRATIHPSVVKLAPGETQKFKIVMMATRLKGAYLAEDVKWAVNDISGGNDELGTIDSTGLYRAPAKTPNPREIHICTEVEEAANRYLWATVLMEAPGPAYKMIHAWTEPRDNPTYLKDPHCVALDKDGNLLIADYHGSRVLRFTPEGDYLGDIGLGIGEGPGQVTKPRAVVTDSAGNIFISDEKSDKPRIQVFNQKGEFLRIFAEKGTGPGHILRAHGLAFDSKQRLFVVDVDNMRVNIYKHSGEFIKSWGKDGPDPGNFNAPHGIVIDRNDDVFVSGYYSTVQKFTAYGDFLFAFAHADPPDGAVYIHSITGDRWGNLYLMVRGMRGYGGKIEDIEGKTVSIMKYNNNGDYVCSLTLEVKAHSENWAAVDDKGLVYAIYMGHERMGFEIFAPQ